MNTADQTGGNKGNKSARDDAEQALGENGLPTGDQTFIQKVKQNKAAKIAGNIVYGAAITGGLYGAYLGTARIVGSIKGMMNKQS